MPCTIWRTGTTESQTDWAQSTGTALPVALSKLTAGPVAVLGRPGGTLAPGAPADLCMYDPAARWRVEPGALFSQGKNTPFLGLELAGKVRYTLVRGEVVFEAASRQ